MITAIQGHLKHHKPQELFGYLGKEIFSSIYFFENLWATRKSGPLSNLEVGCFITWANTDRILFCITSFTFLLPKFKVLDFPPGSKEWMGDEPKKLKGLREIYARNLQLIRPSLKLKVRPWKWVDISVTLCCWSFTYQLPLNVGYS